MFAKPISVVMAGTVVVTGMAAAAAANAAAAPAAVVGVASAPRDVTPVKVAASRIGPGHAVYVRGLDGRVWWRTVEVINEPGYSTTWRPIPGVVASGPDVVQGSPTDVWLAARSTSGSLVVRRQTGAIFGGWQDLGGVITTAPVLAVDTDRVWVFARGADGAVWYRLRDLAGTWRPWRSVGGIVTSAPDAVMGVDGTMQVHARGLDGVLWGRAFSLGSGVWGPWGVTGPSTTSASSTVRSDRVFRLTYYRGADNRVYSLVDGPPNNLGGVATSAPDAAHGGEVVAVRGTDNALWARIHGGPWQRLGGIAA